MPPRVTGSGARHMPTGGAAPRRHSTAGVSRGFGSSAGHSGMGGFGGMHSRPSGGFGFRPMRGHSMHGGFGAPPPPPHRGGYHRYGSSGCGCLGCATVLCMVLAAVAGVLAFFL